MKPTKSLSERPDNSQTPRPRRSPQIRIPHERSQAPPKAKTPAAFSSVDEFVDTFLVKIYERKVTGQSRPWCPQWWKHPEAVLRLKALWRSFEHHRHSNPNTGIMDWSLHHLDPTMRVLLDPQGPFDGCDPINGHVPRRRFQDGLPSESSREFHALVSELEQQLSQARDEL